MVDFAKGLEGVIAAESKVCFIDGDKGILLYRGYDIEDLVRNCSAEEVAYLLLLEELPSKEQLESFNDKLLKYRRLHGSLVRILKSLSKETHPMKALQACFAALGGIWDNSDGSCPDETFIAYISQAPLIIAAHWRILKGQEVVDPDISLSMAANFLYMLTGKRPTQLEEEIFNQLLILHQEHGFNASTFTARVVGSTLATISGSLSGAVGSLSGPLHGGANEKVLKMLDEIGSVDNVENWIDNAIANKVKIMGMGHRVYRTKDPRATILQENLAKMKVEGAIGENFARLRKVEDYFKAKMEAKGKKIYPNVDFYSGTFFKYLGIEPLLFTPIFAVARTVGWAAHLREQWQDNRIFRPRCHYSGPMNLKFPKR